MEVVKKKKKSLLPFLQSSERPILTPYHANQIHFPFIVASRRYEVFILSNVTWTRRNGRGSSPIVPQDTLSPHWDFFFFCGGVVNPERAKIKYDGLKKINKKSNLNQWNVISPEGKICSKTWLWVQICAKRSCYDSISEKKYVTKDGNIHITLLLGGAKKKKKV